MIFKWNQEIYQIIFLMPQKSPPAKFYKILTWNISVMTTPCWASFN